MSHYSFSSDYSKLLDKALYQGKITAKFSKMAMSGAPGTGNSSVMKLLLNQPPLESHHSTPVTTTPEIRKVKTTSKVDRLSFKNMLARTVKNMLRSTTSEFITPPVHNDESESSSDDDGSQDSASSMDKPQSGEVTSHESPSPPVSATTTEFVRMLPIVEESPELYNTHRIYYIDSVGQAAFLDIATALLCYNPVSILTQKLNETLDDHPKFYFSFKNQQLGITLARETTNLQLLASSYRSLASINHLICAKFTSNSHVLSLPFLFLAHFTKKMGMRGRVFGGKEYTFVVYFKSVSRSAYKLLRKEKADNISSQHNSQRSV